MDQLTINQSSYGNHSITCIKCRGLGKNNCPTCVGQGFHLRKGMKKMESCKSCHGQCQVTCSVCKGGLNWTGGAYGTDLQSCYYCDSRCKVLCESCQGGLHSKYIQLGKQETCYICAGAGEIPCTPCLGRGKFGKKKEFNQKISDVESLGNDSIEGPTDKTDCVGHHGHHQDLRLNTEDTNTNGSHPQPMVWPSFVFPIKISSSNKTDVQESSSELIKTKPLNSNDSKGQQTKSFGDTSENKGDVRGSKCCTCNVS